MSLKLTFKKSCTSCPNWVKGGEEVIWTKSKRTHSFSQENIPKLLTDRITDKFEIDEDA